MATLLQDDCLIRFTKSSGWPKLWRGGAPKVPVPHAPTPKNFSAPGANGQTHPYKLYIDDVPRSTPTHTPPIAHAPAYPALGGPSAELAGLKPGAKLTSLPDGAIPFPSAADAKAKFPPKRLPPVIADTPPALSIEDAAEAARAKANIAKFTGVDDAYYPLEYKVETPARTSMANRAVQGAKWLAPEAMHGAVTYGNYQMADSYFKDKDGNPGYLEMGAKGLALAPLAARWGGRGLGAVSKGIGGRFGAVGSAGATGLGHAGGFGPSLGATGLLGTFGIDPVNSARKRGLEDRAELEKTNDGLMEKEKKRIIAAGDKADADLKAVENAPVAGEQPISTPVDQPVISPGGAKAGPQGVVAGQGKDTPWTDPLRAVTAGTVKPMAGPGDITGSGKPDKVGLMGYLQSMPNWTKLLALAGGSVIGAIALGNMMGDDEEDPRTGKRRSNFNMIGPLLGLGGAAAGAHYLSGGDYSKLIDPKWLGLQKDSMYKQYVRRRPTPILMAKQALLDFDFLNSTQGQLQGPAPKVPDPEPLAKKLTYGVKPEQVQELPSEQPKAPPGNTMAPPAPVNGFGTQPPPPDKPTQPTQPAMAPVQLGQRPVAGTRKTEGFGTDTTGFTSVTPPDMQRMNFGKKDVTGLTRDPNATTPDLLNPGLKPPAQGIPQPQPTQPKPPVQAFKGPPPVDQPSAQPKPPAPSPTSAGPMTAAMEMHRQRLIDMRDATQGADDATEQAHFDMVERQSKLISDSEGVINNIEGMFNKGHIDEAKRATALGNIGTQLHNDSVDYLLQTTGAQSMEELAQRMNNPQDPLYQKALAQIQLDANADMFKAQGFLERMDTWEKVMFFGGIGLGVIGLLSAFKGGDDESGGGGGMMMPLLGLGGLFGAGYAATKGFKNMGDLPLIGGMLGGRTGDISTAFRGAPTDAARKAVLDDYEKNDPTNFAKWRDKLSPQEVNLARTSDTQGVFDTQAMSKPPATLPTGISPEVYKAGAEFATKLGIDISGPTINIDSLPDNKMLPALMEIKKNPAIGKVLLDKLDDAGRARFLARAAAMPIGSKEAVAGLQEAFKASPYKPVAASPAQPPIAGPPRPPGGQETPPGQPRPVEALAPHQAALRHFGARSGMKLDDFYEQHFSQLPYDEQVKFLDTASANPEHLQMFAGSDSHMASRLLNDRVLHHEGDPTAPGSKYRQSVLDFMRSGKSDGLQAMATEQSNAMDIARRIRGINAKREYIEQHPQNQGIYDWMKAPDKAAYLKANPALADHVKGLEDPYFSKPDTTAGPKTQTNGIFNLVGNNDPRSLALPGMVGHEEELLNLAVKGDPRAIRWAQSLDPQARNHILSREVIGPLFHRDPRYAAVSNILQAAKLPGVASLSAKAPTIEELQTGAYKDYANPRSAEIAKWMNSANEDDIVNMYSELGTVSPELKEWLINASTGASYGKNRSVYPDRQRLLASALQGRTVPYDHLGAIKTDSVNGPIQNYKLNYSKHIGDGSKYLTSSKTGPLGSPLLPDSSSYEDQLKYLQSVGTPEHIQAIIKKYGNNPNVVEQLVNIHPAYYREIMKNFKGTPRKGYTPPASDRFWPQY